MVLMLDQNFTIAELDRRSEHFDLALAKPYQVWREKKLMSLQNGELIQRSINISTFPDVSKEEIEEIKAQCTDHGVAFYHLDSDQSPSKISTNDLRVFAKTLGLLILDYHHCTEEDGISVLSVSENPKKKSFIPYTNRGLGWHTDGYYNQPQQQIRTMILHCVQPAAAGGENELLDHELMYIQLRDESPQIIEALMQTDCMSIPSYIDSDGNKRIESKGPVFYIDSSTGNLQMRYTARKHNITWKDNKETKEAALAITKLLNNENSYIHKHQLKAGEGMVANNILHNRSPFIDNSDTKRLVYRARYYDSLATINTEQ